jgi:hypothetical protein
MKYLKEFFKSAQFMFVMPIIVMTLVAMGFISHAEHAHAQSAYLLSADRLELKTFSTAGSAGNTGGPGGATAVYWQRPYADSLAEFHIQPDPAAPTAYQNGYWYLPLGAQNTATAFTEEFDLWVPAGAKPQAIEFELQQQTPLGLVFNFAWQFNYSGATIRKFDFGAGYQPGDTTITGAWENVAAFTPFTTNAWHHIKATWARSQDLQTVHQTLEIDGTPVAFTAVARPAFRVPDSFLPRYGAKLNAGFQLDMNPNNGPYSVYVRNMSVKAN